MRLDLSTCQRIVSYVYVGLLKYLFFARVIEISKMEASLEKLLQDDGSSFQLLWEHFRKGSVNQFILLFQKPLSNSWTRTLMTGVMQITSFKAERLVIHLPGWQTE